MPRPASAPRLIARTFDSGFPLSHDGYNGVSRASDGKIYYVLCSASIETGAQMYCYDPVADRIRHLGDLTEASGEKRRKAVPQGKSHVNFSESAGKLYFATHVDYYAIIDGVEELAAPPPGYRPYPGGHFLSYDLASGKFAKLASAPGGEGILAMGMDAARNRLYGLTWPHGCFLRHDLSSGETRNLGRTAEEGQGGKGDSYRVLCRSLAVNPEDGSVYFTTADGAILRYCLERDAIEPVNGDDMRKDYFGQYDPASAGNMGYNWRQTVWYPPEKVFYGVHGNSGYLFRFDPRASRVDVIERLTSEPSRRSGMFDQFTYGYLGFDLGPDGHRLHYLTGAPLYRDGVRVAGQRDVKVGSRGEEDLHLVTYDIPLGRYTDHGPVLLDSGERPSYVNSIAIGADGSVYALSRITANGHTRTDLIQIRFA